MRFAGADVGSLVVRTSYRGPWHRQLKEPGRVLLRKSLYFAQIKRGYCRISSGLWQPRKQWKPWVLSLAFFQHQRSWWKSGSMLLPVCRYSPVPDFWVFILTTGLAGGILNSMIGFNSLCLCPECCVAQVHIPVGINCIDLSAKLNMVNCFQWFLAAARPRSTDVRRR